MSGLGDQARRAIAFRDENPELFAFLEFVQRKAREMREAYRRRDAEAVTQDVHWMTHVGTTLACSLWRIVKRLDSMKQDADEETVRHLEEIIEQILHCVREGEPTIDHVAIAPKEKDEQKG